jgi:hypothetical protein
MENRLSLYGNVREIIVEKLCGTVLTPLLEDLEMFKQKVIWRRFLTLLELIGHGFSKHELMIYTAWWRELMAGRGNTEQEEGGGKIMWNGIIVEEKALIRWALGELGRLREDLVPHAIRKERHPSPLPTGFVLTRTQLLEWQCVFPCRQCNLGKSRHRTIPRSCSWFLSRFASRAGGLRGVVGSGSTGYVCVVWTPFPKHGS